MQLGIWFNAIGSYTTKKKKKNSLKVNDPQLDPNTLNNLRYNKTSLCRITSNLLTSDG